MVLATRATRPTVYHHAHGTWRLAWISILVSALLACGDSPSGAPITATARPNIVLILADDLGVMDVCAYAQALAEPGANPCTLETPNIDSLANEGVVFRRAYAPSLCSPSRASLMTGVFGPELGFNHAFGFRNFKRSYFRQEKPPPDKYLPHDTTYKAVAPAVRPLINASSSTALSPDRKRPSLPMVLPDYRSGFIGKWHLGAGGVAGYQPVNHGFEEIAYLDEGFSPYFNWEKHWPVAGDTQANYLTDDISLQAVKWIRQQATSATPFFLMVSHFAPHSPYQAKSDDVQWFLGQSSVAHSKTSATYAAMVRSLDSSVGAILGALAQEEIRDNTLVIFASDNGALESFNGRRVTSNHPFAGEKATLYEGGIRIPLILNWPAGFKAPLSIGTAVDITDILPTLMEAAQYDMRKYAAYGDGQSLLRLIPSNPRHESYEKSQFFYDPFYRCCYEVATPLQATPKSAVVDGDWKLIFYHQGYVELFDLGRDPYERRDLADARPEVVRRLYAKLRNWEQQIPPRYRSRPNPAYRPEQVSTLPAYFPERLEQR